MESRTKRGLVAAAAIAALTLNLSCLSIHPARQGQVVGPGGRPIPGAFVFYSFRGDSLNLVCSSRYHRPGSMVRTDAEGRFRIRSVLHWHWPYPFQGGTQLEGAIHSTDTHSWVDLPRDPGAAPVVMEDLSADPVRWYECAQRMLTAYLPAMEGGGGAEKYLQVPLEAKRDLCAALASEWRAFGEKFGTRPFRDGDPRTWTGISAPHRKWLANLQARLCRE